VLAALNWVTLHFEGHLLATSWFTFLLVAAFALVATALPSTDGGSPSPRARDVRLTLAGLALGLAAVTRPNALVVLPFVAALLLLPGTAPAVGPGRRARGVALLLAGTAVLVLPVLAANHRSEGEWMIQRNLAFNLYLGNHADSPGYPGIRPGRDWDELVTSPVREGVTSIAGHEAWFRSRVLTFAREDPAAFARLQVRKLLIFLNHREARTTLSPYFFERFVPFQASPVLVGFGLLGPLALVGLARTARRGSGASLAAAFLVPSSALVVLTVVGARYRAPLLPFFGIFAACALVGLARAARRRAGRELLGTAALLVPAVALVHLRFAELENPAYGEELARVATVYQEAGDLEEADRWWAESLREDPARVESWVNRASYAQARGDFAALEEAALAGLRASPGDWLLSMFLGRARLELGRPEESLEALRPVLEVRPGNPDLLAALARAHDAAGRPDSARVWFQRALERMEGRWEIGRDAAALLLREAAARPAGEARTELLSKARIALEAAWAAAPGHPELRSLAAQYDRLAPSRDASGSDG
ncbi:MAG TPA: tetratricopeptide repeat protein, partial [bacterium]|nr:tetratricopeptide repeat protein [bacterium]